MKTKPTEQEEQEFQDRKKLYKVLKGLRDLQHEYESDDKEFARTLGRAKDAIRIKFNLP